MIIWLVGVFLQDLSLPRLETYGSLVLRWIIMQAYFLAFVYHIEYVTISFLYYDFASLPHAAINSRLPPKTLLCFHLNRPSDPWP